MSESEITDVYNKMLEDLVRLCRILLNYQMIHGVDAEDIVQRVVLRALEKKEQLANHKNLYGWFINACKLECITLARRSRIERRRLGISLPLEPEILIEKQQDELIQWLRKSEMGIKRNTVNDAARRIRKKAAGLLFVTLLLCVQGGTFLIL